MKIVPTASWIREVTLIQVYRFKEIKNFGEGSDTNAYKNPPFMLMQQLHRTSANELE
jgi:hypothetical protein